MELAACRCECNDAQQRVEISAEVKALMDGMGWDGLRGRAILVRRTWT